METGRNIAYNLHKIFELNGKYYLYIVNTSGLFEIDERLKKVLELEGKTSTEIYEKVKDIFSKNEFFELIKSLCDLDVIDNNTDENMLLAYETDCSALTLMVAQECNMRCAYCYGDAGEYNHKGKMSIETAKRAVDFLIKNTKNVNLAIAFLGGEPLLNLSLIKEIVEYCHEQGEQHGKSFSYTMTTNGTLITPEVEKFLIEHKITTQISVDGLQEKHDAMRYFANGVGSYSIVLEHTESMRKQKLLSARATLSPDNLNYIEVFEHLHSLGFRAIPISVANNTLSESDKELEMLEYKRYVEYFLQHMKNKDFDITEKMIDIQNALDKIRNAGKRDTGCGAVRRMYAVNVDGNLYPCHRFVGMDKFCMGNIYDEKIVDNSNFLRALGVDNREKCKKCWAKNLCLGGCPYENYIENGHIGIASERFCEHMRFLYENLIKSFIIQNFAK